MSLKIIVSFGNHRFFEFPAFVLFTYSIFLDTSVDLEDYDLRVTMLPNPSHLEAVNPVTAGKARGRQLTLKDGCFSNLADSPLGDKVNAIYYFLFWSSLHTCVRMLDILGVLL